MAITISGENNNDKILASDGVIDQISGFNLVGVVTATSFTGDLTGDVTGNLLGNVTGNINNSTLLLQTGGTERLRIDSTGKATFSGDVQIDGDELFIADSIKHTGDTDTLISFPSNDTINFRTAGTERFRIDSDGVIATGTEHKFTSGTSGDCKLIIEADTDNNNETDNPIILLRQDGGLDLSAIGHNFSGDTSANNEFFIANSVSAGSIVFYTGGTNGYTNGSERLRITSGGNVDINGTPPWSVTGGDYRNLSIYQVKLHHHLVSFG